MSYAAGVADGAADVVAGAPEAAGDADDLLSSFLPQPTANKHITERTANNTLTFVFFIFLISFHFLYFIFLQYYLSDMYHID